jgi:hypothetical protein
LTDILDLDALVPPVKEIKIKGKLIKCYPLTIRQLVTLAKLENKLINVKTEDEIIPLIKEALKPFIPEIENDEIDFTIQQLREIVRFAQSASIPQEATQAKEFDPKKKDDLAKESPTSSTPTQPTS